MSLLYPVDTLAYQASRPVCQNRNMSSVPVASVTKAISKYMGASDFEMAVPETSALNFYALNHCRAILGQKFHNLEPLSSKDELIVNKFYEVTNAEAIRNFYYLLLICTRESRHAQGHCLYDLHKLVTAKHSKECSDFNAKIHNSGSTGAWNALLKSPPNTSIGQFCRSLQTIFYEGSFNSGFGGPAWGKIADCLVNFVEGIYSGLVMVDTVWTLNHNNGPIYNKQMLFSDYSDTLVRILDVQRSGQVIEAIRSDKKIAPYASAMIEEFIARFEEFHPDAFGHYVDWFKVENLGSIHTYPVEKKEQLSKHGLSAKQLAEMTAAQKKVMEDAKAKAEEAKNFSKKNFEYWPGKFLPIIKPKSRAA